MNPRCAFCGRDIEPRWYVVKDGESIKPVIWCSIACREQIEARTLATQNEKTA